MRVLALNPGSSSLKYRVADVHPDVDARPAVAVVADELEGIGSMAAAIEEALRRVAATAAFAPRDGIGDAVGVRVVHGGERFRSPTVVDDEALDEIERLRELAPLHNGPSLEVIRRAREHLGGAVPVVAVFDTDFHRTMPRWARTYAIPGELAAAHGLHRYGFHGLAHRSMAEQHAAATDRAGAKLVTLQLGNGCSAAAVDGGRSVTTSMGLTPAEGLVMGSRSGDVDPTLVAHLARVAACSVDEAADVLEHRSGLLGLSGTTNDMRTLLELADQGDDRAALAIDVFCARVTHYVGGYLALLGGADAVVFGGGIGERAAPIRRRVCSSLAWAGLEHDGAADDAVADELRADAPVRISSTGSRLEAWVVAVDEEAIIARSVADLLAR